MTCTYLTLSHISYFSAIDQLNSVTTLYQQPIVNTAPDETIHTYPDSTQCECPSVVANTTDNDGATLYTSHEGDNGTITVALAGVSAVLLLIIIGVVICWVCTCYRASKIPSR